jgi:hypothetical protein
MMDKADILDQLHATLDQVIEMVNRSNANGLREDARRWAIVRTDLEKVIAWTSYMCSGGPLGADE